MKKILIAAFGLLVCLADVSLAKNIRWKDFSIHLSENWTRSDTEDPASSRLTLESRQSGLHCLVKVSSRPLNAKPVGDYRAWLEKYADQWKSFKFTSSVVMDKGPLTLLGHAQCPVARGRNNTAAVYQFLPLVKNRVYSVVVNLDPYDRDELPSFVTGLLEQMSIAGIGGRPVTVSAEPADDQPAETVVTDFSPANGSMGTLITIKGKHLGREPVVGVTFGDIPVPVTHYDDNHIYCVIPGGFTEGVRYKPAIRYKDKTLHTDKVFQYQSFKKNRLIHKEIIENK
ncbi:MAG: IPT/TIG domain-containing protein, partial [Chlorobiales bacterium]|nr:IPT/TIG domain-containing protein [Chlorobiales bacterium]